MKKTYSKPQIVFDSFELSQSIAAGCEVITNQAQNVCPLIDDESAMVLFADTKACETTPPTGTDMICYDVPAESYNVFTS